MGHVQKSLHWGQQSVVVNVILSVSVAVGGDHSDMIPSLHVGIADSLYWSMHLACEIIVSTEGGKNPMRTLIHMLTTIRMILYTNRFSFSFQSTGRINDVG